MIKYILRKPLFPILLLALILFAVLFMGSLRRGIERDIQTVNDMYDNAVITFEALPGADGSGELHLYPHFGDDFENMEEFEKAYSTMTCPYSLREPEAKVGFGRLYGTNDTEWFAESNRLTVEWAEGFGFGMDNDWNSNDGDIPCIADSEYLAASGLKAGDHFTVAPYDMSGEDREKAPSVSMYIIGSFDNETEILERNSLIVPECIFLEEPSILYYWRMMENYCAFNQYKIVVRQEYNRNVDEIESKIQATADRAKIVMHSDVRILKKATRPVEQRLRIQKALEGPLEVALAIAAALMAVLMAIGVQDDIFLYILQGESRAKTFLKMLLNLSGIMLAWAAVAALAGMAMLGTDWLVWMAEYLGTIIILCIAAAAVTILRFCYKNLVNFYQTKEG